MGRSFSTEKEVHTVPYPYEGLNAKIGGCRLGEIVTVTAGSGLGKSQLTREFAYHLLNEGATIGYVALRGSKRTAQGLMSLYLNKLVHLQDVPTDELREAFDATIGTGRVFMYDHWGSTESDNLLAKIQIPSKWLWLSIYNSGSHKYCCIRFRGW